MERKRSALNTLDPNTLQEYSGTRPAKRKVSEDEYSISLSSQESTDTLDSSVFYSQEETLSQSLQDDIIQQHILENHTTPRKRAASASILCRDEFSRKKAKYEHNFARGRVASTGSCLENEPNGPIRGSSSEDDVFTSGNVADNVERPCYGQLFRSGDGLFVAPLKRTASGSSIKKANHSTGTGNWSADISSFILEKKRELANSRERQRMGKINKAFNLLRDHVPVFKCSRKASKLAILNGAIDYIKELRSSKTVTRHEGATSSQINEIPPKAAAHLDNEHGHGGTVLARDVGQSTVDPNAHHCFVHVIQKDGNTKEHLTLKQEEVSSVLDDIDLHHAQGLNYIAMLNPNGKSSDVILTQAKNTTRDDYATFICEEDVDQKYQDEASRISPKTTESSTDELSNLSFPEIDLDLDFLKDM